MPKVMRFSDLKNESPNEFADISSEEYRVYEFESGKTLKIISPIALSVSKSGGHRVWDAMGISHYIPANWVHLYWEVKEGQPNFVK